MCEAHSGANPTFYPEIPSNLMFENCEFCEKGSQKCEFCEF